MPFIRKRIGYLPSINAQETITKIANRENLSQSKVVGIFVEEALSAKSGFDFQNPSDLIRKKLYGKRNNKDYSSFNYNDLDEFISDKGITYNKKTYNYNKELFEQFKQFILFQKMAQAK